MSKVLVRGHRALRLGRRLTGRLKVSTSRFPQARFYQAESNKTEFKAEEEEDYDEDEEYDEDGPAIEESSSTMRVLWMGIGCIIVGGMCLIPVQDKEALEPDTKIMGGVRAYRTICGWFEKDDSLLAPPLQPDSFGRIPRTLVMNFDKTIGYAVWSRENGWQVRKRPNSDELFQRSFYNNFELAVWDGKDRHEVEQHVVDMDPLQLARIRLFREHCNASGLNTVKDISRLGRDLNRIIVIDLDPNSCTHPENVIKVSPFVDNPDDDELSKVAKFVEDVYRYNIPDVRPAIKRFNESGMADIFADDRYRFDQARDQLSVVVKGVAGSSTGPGFLERLGNLFSTSSKTKTKTAAPLASRD